MKKSSELTKKPLRVAVLANWGLGLSLLEALFQMPEVAVSFVVTNFRPDDPDPWRNKVFQLAKARSCPLYHEKELGFAELRQLLVSMEVDLAIAHAYMRILPDYVFSAPRLGTVNIHPSLLPRHRGPSPTHWVLRQGDDVTGLTSHYVDSGIDTGDIIHQLVVPVEKGDTIVEIIEKQKKIMKELVRETILKATDRSFVPIKQDAILASVLFG